MSRWNNAPLWKWIVIILLVLSIPLFFAFYRDAELQQVLQETTS